MKIFEVTFDNGETHTIEVEDWKKGTETLLQKLKKIDNSGSYEPWTILTILQKGENKNGETI